MGDDWEELAGEEGEEVPSNRLGRMFKLGKMGARVGASSLANKLKNFLPGDREKRDADLSDAYTENAKYMAKVFGQLKGASMKVGHVVSSIAKLASGP